MNHHARLFVATILFAATTLAEDKPPRSDEEILKTVKLPDGYEATVFAKPPEGGYPTSVSAAIDGTIFVAIDENGSLGRDRNKDDRKPGRVVRMRDTNGDGKADESKTFAEMESPRGVIWDGSGFDKATGKMPGTLIVMHPPNLTAYTDTDGDGVADKQEDIVTGLGFGLDFRGADHTTNGCRLAIDGFIYIAVGDYGFINARGKDGARISNPGGPQSSRLPAEAAGTAAGRTESNSVPLSNRGGGIVRVRPDGTGLEIVSRGQRNIYDVAVSPTLDLFTRDNTNDGGGWNVRLSHVPPGAHMGYPTLFVNFPEDHIQPLADYGGGSPCGALWLDEPGLPSGLFTVEWGRNAIMRHTLKPKGAGWELDGPNQGQEEWIKLVRPTDMDVDAAGRLYITSWEGATFNYNGPNAGYVLRVVKKEAGKLERPGLAAPQPVKMPAALAAADELALLELLQTNSAVVRLAAQREFLRRAKDEPSQRKIGELLEGWLMQASTYSTSSAVAVFTTASQIARRLPAVNRVVVPWMLERDELREFVLRSYGDGLRKPAEIPNEPTVAGLSDNNPRVRAAAITALRRLGKSDAAPSILPLVADPDPVVSHLAIRALTELKAVQVCLAGVDIPSSRVRVVGTRNAKLPTPGQTIEPDDQSADVGDSPAIPPGGIAGGALQALYGIYEPAVVDGLLARLSTAKGPLRQGILNALCRLDLQDAPYLDPKEWWGTRPDTSGPVYKPVKWSESEKIEAALKREADNAKGMNARWLIQRMYLTKVSFPGLIEQMLAACGNDTPARLTAIEGLFRTDNSLPAEAVKALSEITADATQPAELRARALRQLARGSSHGSVFPAATATFASLAGKEIGQPSITAVFEDFTRDAKNTKWIGDFVKAMNDKDPQKRALAATVLINLASSTLVKGKDHDAAAAAVEKGWGKPESAAALLSAIARTKSKAFAAQVEARLKDPNNTVAEAALFAHQSLGLGAAVGALQKQIGEMKYEEVFAAVKKGGDAKAGQEMFLRAGCIACHTIDASEPPKGPILSAAAKIYDRAALTESILKPNAKIAQGFESAFFKTKKGEQIEGFVTREGGDSLDVRNIIGQTVMIEKGDIAERGHRPQSMMPEGLLNAFTPTELANLLAYLESLKGK